MTGCPDCASLRRKNSELRKTEVHLSETLRLMANEIAILRAENERLRAGKGAPIGAA